MTYDLAITDTDTLRSLIERLEAAEGPRREMDLTIACRIGLGTDMERDVFAKHGPDGFLKHDHNGFTALHRAQGAHVAYSRPGRGKEPFHRECIIPVTGPLPLSNCAAYTASIDAALSLLREVLPGTDEIILESHPPGGWQARLAEWRLTPEPRVLWRTSGLSEHLPLAICIAVLKAKLTEMEADNG